MKEQCKDEKLRLLVQPVLGMAVHNRREDNDCCDAMLVVSMVPPPPLTSDRHMVECCYLAQLHWPKDMVYRPEGLVVDVDEARSLDDGRAGLRQWHCLGA